MLRCHGGVKPVHRLASELVDQVGVGRAGTHEDRVVSGLAGLADGADGLADDGAEHNHVAARCLQTGDLRREIGGAALVAGFLGQLHADAFQAGFGAAHHLQPELVVLVHGADLLGAFVLDHLWHGGAHLVEVSGGEGIFEPVERLVHLARRCHGEEVDHVLLELHRHGRHVLRRADVADHGEDLVLVDQLLRCQHSLLRVVSRVFDDQLDLAAIDATLLVDLVDPQQHAQPHLLAETGDRARQVLDRTQRDLALADTLIGVLGQRRIARAHRARRGQQGQSH